MFIGELLYFKRFQIVSWQQVGEGLAPPAEHTIIKPLWEKEECTYLYTGGAIRHRASSKLPYYAVRFPPLRTQSVSWRKFTDVKHI